MTDIISWDKAIDKKVKSSDDQDLGKIESITTDYIQTKEGVVSKNYYFIPKYYISGYDGEKLWVSLTKDVVKKRFESEKEPEKAVFETPDYIERKSTVVKEYPDFEASVPPFVPSAAGSLGQDNKLAMPWDKIIDKKVKSSDQKDVGKVQSISTDYLEVEEGVVSKKRYYIPKYYIQGFDGDNLYASLTKDELKERYERDSPPDPSEFRTEEYRRQAGTAESTNPQFVHGVPWMAKEPATRVPVDYSGTTYNIPWEEIIHKSVRTTDNVEVGYIERIGNEFIVVREGVSNIHIYYIPKTYIEEYDGKELWIGAPSGLVSAKFERDTEPSSEDMRSLAREAPRVKRSSIKEETIRERPVSTAATTTASNSPDSVTVEQEIDVKGESDPRTRVKTDDGRVVETG